MDAPVVRYLHALSGKSRGDLRTCPAPPLPEAAPKTHADAYSCSESPVKLTTMIKAPAAAAPKITVAIQRFRVDGVSQRTPITTPTSSAPPSLSRVVIAKPDSTPSTTTIDRLR